jgi:cell wall-associated NlpC family hydrolase
VTSNNSPESTRISVNNNPEIAEVTTTENIINTATSYEGTPYRYGGTTGKGMDCSGLLYTSFAAHDVSIPRTSSLMFKSSSRVSDRQIKKGDLVFFSTGKNRKRINHVGLVVEDDPEDIKFIHASTSRGVIISSLEEGYWSEAYKEARRIL